jgi:hypothetical protein
MANNLTIWKLILMDYNAGSQCVINALVSTFKFTERTMNQSEISARVYGGQCNCCLACANQITA